MYTFDINSDAGALGTKQVTPSNVEKYRADFCVFLDRGVILASVTVAVNAGAASTASGAALSMDHKAVTWFFNAASSEEQVTMTLTVTTNDGQTLKYTILYAVG